MLDKTSQLLIRQQLFTSDDVLLVNAQDAYAEQTGAASHYLHWGHYQQFGDLRAKFGAEVQQRATQVVLYVPKEKSLALMLLDNLAAVMQPTDTLYLVGDNKGGIRSLAKKLPANWGNCIKIASGNHCLLYSTQLLEPAPFNLSSYLTPYLIDTADKTLKVFNLPGVFSHQHLDPGTDLLLQHLPLSISGKVLDFACGSGVIASWLGKYSSAESIHLSDVSALALQASQHTLNANQVQASCIASDGLNQVAGNYDWIISNPPFHTGKNTDYEIARRFFAAAPSQLNKNGRLLIVANSFLPYPELLGQYFKTVVEKANNGRFRILEAH
ncbi:hypothetical protein CWE09_07130 [Aliidiomarina minuta]|uniref:Ribosomal RNA small subunit methyltransferase C n=1 Tax=Aliidiomarina minuta TaxID=880057 RepID=A0A432W8K5_9GAMM|nr:class I SAM-dependent methyltransferase [Aliidiomarina minuta]RUO26473.1 hypothetical protein CWE09_07130 [Aliidiomarina minuta]